jgi:hypothetical protein
VLSAASKEDGAFESELKPTRHGHVVVREGYEFNAMPHFKKYTYLFYTVK